MGYRRRTGDRWVWLALIPLGLGSWAPLVVGIRYRVRSWMALGVFWALVTLVGFGMAGGNNPTGADVGTAIVLFAWAGGAVTAFQVRRRKRRWLASAPLSGYAASVAAGPAARARDLWPWISVLPIGLGSWAPLVAALRCRVWFWALPAMAGVAATISGFVLEAAANRNGVTNQTDAVLGTVLFAAAWFGGICASFAIRPAYDTRRGLAPRDRPAWPQPSARSLTWSAGYGVAAFLGTFVAVIVLAVILRYVFVIHVEVGPGVLIVDAILLSGLVPLAHKRGLSLGDLGVRPTLALRSLWLVVLGFVAYFMFAAVWGLVFISRSVDHQANVLSGVHQLGTVGVVVTVIAIAISAPVVEEIFFRGLLYRSLRNRLPVAPAALIAGMLFGLVHITGYPLITLPVKAGFGVLACLLYERTGSILPGIALHSFVDATGVDLGLTGNDDIVLIVAGTLAAVILLRALFGRSREAQPVMPFPQRTRNPRLNVPNR